MCFGLAQLPFHSVKDVKDSFFSTGDDIGNDTETNTITSNIHSSIHDNSEDYNEYNIIPKIHCKFLTPDELISADIQNKTKKSFNIFHNNLNGLENKFDILHQFLATSIDYDIIALTETSQKVNIEFISNVNIENYSLFSIGSSVSRGGSALYVKNNYNARKRFDLESCSNLFEAIWVEIEMNCSRNIICGSVYRHPKNITQNFNAFLDYLDTCLSKLARENKEIYVCGDFNADWLKIGVNSNYKLFYDQMFNFGFSPLISLPTRIQGNSETVIDNIFTNTPYYDTLCGNISTDISDHFSQFASIPRSTNHQKKKDFLIRDYSNFSEENFRRDVALLNFNFSTDDVNAQHFYDKLQSCVNTHVPLKKVSQKKFDLDLKPWITPDLQKMIRIKNLLFKKKKRQKDNINTKRAYNLFRNRVIRGLKKAKVDYYNKYFQENNNNINKTWKGIKSIVNVNNKKNSQITQLKSDGKSLTSDQDIANEFNNFFANIGPLTEKCIPRNPIADPKKFLKDRIQTDFLLTFVSNDEILDIIQSLENKCIGPNSIPIRLLKLIPDLILVPICKIINNSFSSGVFPNALKISKVIPLHKEGSSDDVNNYRPISILSIFDKIIEKVMHQRLYDFLLSKNILFKNQFGFRKKYSTTHALLEITEKIKDSIEKKKYGCGIFVDIRKAFDTVNHTILLTKLEHYGIRGKALQWFKSYLTNRQQFVEINGVSSNLRYVLSGVPQGSCLGPLLFLIYINDLPNTSKILNFFLFADDTNIYFEHNSLSKLQYIINKELRKINDWLIINRLSLNIKKTNFIIFHSYNKPSRNKITLIFGKKAIKECLSIKYLGIIFDSTLTWKGHCDKISNSISRATGILYKIRPFVKKETLIMLYYSLVYPHLIYGIEVWGSSMITNITKIYLMQKKIVRMITRNDIRMDNYAFPSSEPLFYDLKILKLKDIHTLYICKFVYKWTQGHVPLNFTNWFTYTSQVHQHNTRRSHYNGVDSKLLYQPFGRTTHYGCKKLQFLAPKMWNNIGPEIRLEPSIIRFKSHLKKYLLNAYSSTTS